LGCDRDVAKSSKNVYRSVCSRCHTAGYKNKVIDGVTPIKKSYCENIDSRIGFTCTTTIIYQGQLELDHIDGDHFNNIPSNIQTLCKDCHSVKSHLNKDYKKKAT
jgi:5-methylcytosine-specific restriction endonuclease McrA